MYLVLLFPVLLLIIVGDALSTLCVKWMSEVLALPFCPLASAGLGPIARAARAEIRTNDLRIESSRVSDCCSFSATNGAIGWYACAEWFKTALLTFLSMDFE